MTKSLRRQKILLERALKDAVARGFYVQDKENPNNYRLKEPFPEEMRYRAKIERKKVVLKEFYDMWW